MRASQYTRDVILPNLARGAARQGRTLEDLEVSGAGFVVTGPDEQELERQRQVTKGRIAFYASTRKYAPVMSAHGWDDTAEKLYRMSVDGQWSEMPAQITDEMLDEFAVTGLYDEIPRLLVEKYGDMLDEVLIYFGEPEKGDPENWRVLLDAFDATA